MNIFALESQHINEPLRNYARRVAKSHCDKHQKQILENWQMLNTCANVLGIKTDNASMAYANHPCTVWVRSSLENWQFTYMLTEELALEMQRRYGRKDIHKSWLRVQENIPFSPDALSGSLTPFAQALPDDIKDAAESPIEAYREYYNTHKAFFSRRVKTKGTFGQEMAAYKIEPASWKNQDKPSWWYPVTLDKALSKGYITANDGSKRFALSHKDIIVK